jgi:hypothetical protein
MGAFDNRWFGLGASIWGLGFWICMEENLYDSVRLIGMLEFFMVMSGQYFTLFFVLAFSSSSSWVFNIARFCDAELSKLKSETCY